jgi:hypothetical protein
VQDVGGVDLAGVGEAPGGFGILGEVAAVLLDDIGIVFFGEAEVEVVGASVDGGEAAGAGGEGVVQPGESGEGGGVEQIELGCCGFWVGLHRRSARRGAGWYSMGDCWTGPWIEETFVDGVRLLRDLLRQFSLSSGVGVFFGTGCDRIRSVCLRFASNKAAL